MHDKYQRWQKTMYTTVELRFYDRRSNDIPDLAINIPGKSYL